MITIWLVHRPSGAKFCVSHGGSMLHKLHAVDGELGFFVPLKSQAWKDFVVACGGPPEERDLDLEIEGDPPAPV